MTKENTRLVQAIEKAGSARKLALDIGIGERQMQRQASRGYCKMSIAKKIQAHYRWPRKYLLDLVMDPNE